MSIPQADLDRAKQTAYKQFAKIKVATDVSRKTMEQVIVKAQQTMKNNGMATVTRLLQTEADQPTLDAFASSMQATIQSFTAAMAKLQVTDGLLKTLTNADVKIEAAKTSDLVAQCVADMQAGFLEYQQGYNDAMQIFTTNQALGGPMTREDQEALNAKINLVVQASVDKINARLPASQAITVMETDTDGDGVVDTVSVDNGVGSAGSE